MKRELLLVAVAVGLLSGALGACKPKAGGSCKIETKEVCVDEKLALACHDGVWEEMSCRGPDGCSKNGGEHWCDQSVAEEKDVCNLVDDFVCTADNKAMLQCSKNKWTLAQRCLGERGCVMDKKKRLVTCDDSIANAGDVCREKEDYACTPDQKAVLECKDGHFVQAGLCQGPEGCRVIGSKDTGFKVVCDDSVAALGDACEKEGHYSCTADERIILKCRNKKFEVEEKCRSREKCQIRDGHVGCY